MKQIVHCVWKCSALSQWVCVWQDYELQLMTYRAFVESTQKSPVKRRRMHSSSDAITQEVGMSTGKEGWDQECVKGGPFGCVS